LAALLSGAAAVWVVGALFDGRGALIACGAGLLLGVGLAVAGLFGARSSMLTWAVLPAAVAAGALAMVPVAAGGTANLPGLVAELIAGGADQPPPLPFEPGWRFLLVVLFTVVPAFAVTAADVFGRPKLATLLPLPLVLGGAALQPAQGSLGAILVALPLLLASLMVIAGAGLAGDGELGLRFELRRLGGAGALLVVLLALVVGLSRADVLFPSVENDRIIPPQRPPAVPLEDDRVLFRVQSDAVGPWRVGVLDVYDGAEWLLPPTDPARLVDVQPRPADDHVQVTSFAVVDMRGRVLPTPAGVDRVVDASGRTQFDPRAEVLQLQARVPAGFRYTVELPKTRTSEQLNAARPADPDIVAAFTEVPGQVPPAVVQLLARAPAPVLDRLQFLRNELYGSVVAAGAGSPRPVGPARVADMLKPGTEATPFEIVAAEALLARWAGLPARIGFGYYQGQVEEKADSPTREFHPKHGAAWLEVDFGDLGWVPLVGEPRNAKPSDSNPDKNELSTVLPSEELAITVLIPVKQSSLLRGYQIARYWLLVTLPWLLAAAAAYATYPALCKALRQRRRRRWAAARSPRHRILAAYADLRDELDDHNIGAATLTPLELISAIAPDTENEELAWLVTRALWGDLSRGTTGDDADDAVWLAASVLRRIRGAHSLGGRLVALSSRRSLREPWTAQVPNVWPRVPVRRRARALRPAAVLHGLRSVTLRPATAAALVLVVMTMLTGCAKEAGFGTAQSPSDYPARTVPDPPGELLGYRFPRDAEAESQYERNHDVALVNGGRVHRIEKVGVVQGTVQFAVFKPDVNGASVALQEQVERGVGGRFSDFRIGTVQMRMRESPTQRVILWFPPDRNVVVSIYFRREFSEYERLVFAIVGYELGLPPEYLLSPDARFCDTADAFFTAFRPGSLALPRADRSAAKKFSRMARQVITLVDDDTLAQQLRDALIRYSSGSPRDQDASVFERLRREFAQRCANSPNDLPTPMEAHP